MAESEDGVAAAQAAVAAGERAADLVRAIEREHQLESKRCASLRATFEKEDDDVEDLEGWTLKRVIASLTSRRDQRLFDERAEREIARLELAIREDVLIELATDLDAAREAATSLSTAQATLAKALEARGFRLLAENGPRGQQLATLIDQQSRFRAEQKELREALEQGRRAQEALHRASTALSSAGGWSTYDTFFGGGMISSMIKHGKLDDAASHIKTVHLTLLRLRAELADLDVPTSPALDMPSSGLRGFDIWFDNMFSDWMVHDRIRASQRSVETAMRAVSKIVGELTPLERGAQNNLDRIDEGRRQLLLDSSSDT